MEIKQNAFQTVTKDLKFDSEKMRKVKVQNIYDWRTDYWTDRKS